MYIPYIHIGYLAKRLYLGKDWFALAVRIDNGLGCSVRGFVGGNMDRACHSEVPEGLGYSSRSCRLA